MVESYYELRYLRRTPGSGDDNKPLISEEVIVQQDSAATALVGKVSAGSTIQVTNIGAAILTVFPRSRWQYAHSTQRRIQRQPRPKRYL